MVERKQIEYQKILKFSKELNLLIVEDVMEDLALIVRTLKSNGVKFTYNVADSKLNYQKLLQDNVYDAILSNYSLADFDIFEVLKLLRKSGQEIPVILIIDDLQEEKAFECLKAGVNNYIFQDRLLSLSIILERALNLGQKKNSNVPLLNYKNKLNKKQLLIALFKECVILYYIKSV